MSDLYTRLAVSPTATPHEILAAYDRLRAQYVLAGNDPAAQQHLHEIEDAYATLSDPQRRVAYDQSLRQATPTALEPSFNLATSEINTPDNPLAASGARLICHHCGTPNPVRATRCSGCGEQIARSCPSCGYRIALDQLECPRCQTVVAEYDYRRYAEATLTNQRTQEQRKETEQRAVLLEQLHRENNNAASMFWLITGIIIIGCLVFVVLFTQ